MGKPSPGPTAQNSYYSYPLWIPGDEFVNVTFAEKPDRTILNALKAAGFHWAGGSWGGYRSRLPEEVLNLTSEGRGE